MNRTITGLVLAVATTTMLGSHADAHVSYSGRDFGSYTGLGSSTLTLETNVTGDYGWADATDEDFGDSHRSRAFRFHLDGPATVTITATGIARTGGLGGLLPGFSLYRGLAHIAGPGQEGDHDTAPISLAYLATLGGVQPKEGAWIATADWKIGSESFPDLSEFSLVGYAVDGTAANFGAAPGIVGDGTADGTVTRSFALGAGDYSLFVGGALYAGQPAPSDTARPPNFGLSVNLAVDPVPEPATALLVGAAVTMLLGARRRFDGTAR
jgi:hypothetical protein